MDGGLTKQRREIFNLNTGEWIGLIDKGFDQKKYSWASPFTYLNRNTDVQSLVSFSTAKLNTKVLRCTRVTFIVKTISTYQTFSSLFLIQKVNRRLLISLHSRFLSIYLRIIKHALSQICMESQNYWFPETSNKLLRTLAYLKVIAASLRCGFVQQLWMKIYKILMSSDNTTCPDLCLGK